MMNNSRIEKEKLLIVEGKDETHFFKALLKHIGIQDIQIIEVGGKDRFKDEFPALLLSPDFSRVTRYAIIRDADNNANNTFQSITDLLNKHNQPIPPAPGKIMSSDGISAGIFIMPGNAEEGMLEDLCLHTIVNHPVLSCADSYISCLRDLLENEEENVPKNPEKYYFPKNEAKAKMHAFLAGMNKYVPSLGLAAEKGYFNLESEIMNDIKCFLKDFAE